MFGKLKDKLKAWTKKVASAEQEQAEKPIILKKEDETKKIEVPVQFDVAKHKFEPDTEKLQDLIEEVSEEAEPSTTKEPSTEEVAPSTAEKEELTTDNIPSEASKSGAEVGDAEVEKQGLLQKLGSKITKKKISEEEFNVYADELQELLLENNVAFEVAEKIINELREHITGKELLRKEIEDEITDIFKDIIREILINPFLIADKVNEKWEKEKEPYVVLFCGINGSGKTTTVAKIASNLKKQGISSVLAAGDTFRAAAIEQLQEHGEKIGVKVIAHEHGSDAAAVGFDAIKYAKKNLIKCVLIDTAGRMHTSKDLMREIEKIVKVTKPDLKIFVGESITGNDSIEQAKSFNWSIGIDGIVLSKSDIDEKGGTSLSVGYVTKKPILYLGTGQVYEDIEPFDKEQFLKRLGL